MRPGDTVWTPPGEEHWHGATSENMMCHFALDGDGTGDGTTWLEPVTSAVPVSAARLTQADLRREVHDAFPLWKAVREGGGEGDALVPDLSRYRVEAVRERREDPPAFVATNPDRFIETAADDVRQSCEITECVSLTDGPMLREDTGESSEKSVAFGVATRIAGQAGSPFKMNSLG